MKTKIINGKRFAEFEIKCEHCKSDITYNIELSTIKEKNEWAFFCSNCENDTELDVDVNGNVTNLRKAFWNI